MALQNEKNSRYLLRDWKPENPAFWENKGKHIARRNLWISVSCLLLAFCVWMLFSAVTVNLNKIGFNFTTDQLFLLTALPSVSGALLRVPYSFMVPIFGGRRWTVFSTAILIIPCVWLGIAVQNPDCLDAACNRRRHVIRSRGDIIHAFASEACILDWLCFHADGCLVDGSSNCIRSGMDQ